MTHIQTWLFNSNFSCTSASYWWQSGKVVGANVVHIYKVTAMLKAWLLLKKKLCYGRRTTRRACQYRKTACNQWITLTYTQGHHSCCYKTAIQYITYCLWTVVSTFLSTTGFWDTTILEVNVTACDLENSSLVTTKLKLQTMCTF